MTELQTRLIAVQSELKAPKDKFNSFGNYSYRSAEGIMEALKPLLKEHELCLTVNDDIILVGDRFYIKATATVSYGKETITNSAFAREEATKKGMDGSQITGTASSYARKYALNGLFLIDDTKDADTDEYQKTTAEKPNKATTNAKPNRDALVSYCKENGLDMGKIAKDFKLNGNVPDKVFAEVLKKLKGEEE